MLALAPQPLTMQERRDLARAEILDAVRNLKTIERCQKHVTEDTYVGIRATWIRRLETYCQAAMTVGVESTIIELCAEKFWAEIEMY